MPCRTSDVDDVAEHLVGHQHPAHCVTARRQFRRTGNGQLLEGGPIQFGWSATVPAPGDFDGDGLCDIAVFHQATGDWYIRQSSDGQMPGGVPVNWGWYETLPAPGDFDGDGVCDKAVYYPATGTWYIDASTAGPTEVRWGF